MGTISIDLTLAQIRFLIKAIDIVLEVDKIAPPKLKIADEDITELKSLRAKLLFKIQ